MNWLSQKKKTGCFQDILPVNLFQCCTNDFYRQEFKKFVSNIERRIKYKIPKHKNKLFHKLNVCGERKTYQTIVDKRSWLLFFKGAKTGSPSNKLAKIPPENMTSIEEIQSERGCFREKGSEPKIKTFRTQINIYSWGLG